MVSRGLIGTVVVAVLALGACATEEPAPEPTITVAGSTDQAIASVDFDELSIDGDDPGVDPCGLAQALPADDMCSLVCDPQALADRMLSGGARTSTCYQLRCALSPTVSVSVGVCLP